MAIVADGIQYAEQVVAGEIVACELVRLACQRFLNDLENGPERGIYFIEDRAQHILDFYSFIPHVKGALAGKPIDLMPWHIFILINIFGFVIPLIDEQTGIRELWQVRATDNEAWAQEVKEIYSAVGDNKSAIKETQTSITKLDEAFGQRFTEIRTEMDKAQADIVSNSTAIANTNKAFAENKTQVQAQFDEQQGMIEEKMQATFEQSGDGVVAHSINITIVHNNVKYNAAGQVISAQVKNGKLESFFGYNANNFAWYNPANGKMELFMYAKNGQFFVRDLFIEDGSITNAKIGNVIQSNNYVAGKSGWIINKNGYAEFDNAKFRGEIKATKGTMNNVIIDKDCEIKGTLKVENIEGDIVKFYSLGNGETITIPAQSFDRVIQVVTIATTHNSKWCRLWLNDDKFFEIKNGGNYEDFVYWNSPSTTLKANTPGVFRYDSEDRYFKITLLACKQ